MSKEKLEKDYQAFNLQIEKLAEEELKNIKEKANAIKSEASTIGENFELSLNNKAVENSKKKIK